MNATFVIFQADVKRKYDAREHHSNPRNVQDLNA